MTSSLPDARKVTLRSGLVADVLSKGGGPPLIFLHSAYGRTWPTFLDRLAEHFTVHAPMSPGGDEPDELMSFDGFSDLSLFYDDLLRALDIDRAAVVGHSFGGMVAAEFAAQHPERVGRLVLVSALGLWIDEAPVGDIHTTNPRDLASLLFADPLGAPAKSVFEPPRPEDTGSFMLGQTLALGAASHFYWPIPDRDLKRRLYRISAPTLLLWGAADRVVPIAYARKFAAGIADARIAEIPGAGHFPHLEKPDAALDAILAFAGRDVNAVAI